MPKHNDANNKALLKKIKKQFYRLDKKSNKLVQKVIELLERRRAIYEACEPMLAAYIDAHNDHVKPALKRFNAGTLKYESLIQMIDDTRLREIIEDGHQTLIILDTIGDQSLRNIERLVGGEGSLAWSGYEDPETINVPAYHGLNSPEGGYSLERPLKELLKEIIKADCKRLFKLASSKTVFNNLQALYKVQQESASTSSSRSSLFAPNSSNSGNLSHSNAGQNCVLTLSSSDESSENDCAEVAKFKP